MLNDAQRGRLEIVLRAVEDKMRTMQYLIDCCAESRLMSELKNDLTPESRAASREKIPAVYDRIRWLRDRFELHVETRPTSREMYAGLSLLWVDLQESMSKRLQEFGHVNPVDADTLDPELAQLAEWMLDLQRSVVSQDIQDSPVNVKRGVRASGQRKDSAA